MEEIDNIILHSLREIGCSLDDDIQTLSQLVPEVLVDAVSKCLLLINSELDIPKTLPPGMAQRYAVTQKLADSIKSIGFRGDVGYQTLLYSNTIEVRRVLMYLVENLPKETDKSAQYISSSDDRDKLSQKKHEISSNIASQLKSPWVPDFCRASIFYNKTESPGTNARNFAAKRLFVPYVRVTQKEITEDIKDYWRKHSPSVFQQTDKTNLLPSILYDNDRSLCALPDDNKLLYQTGSYESLKALEATSFSVSKSSSLDGVSEHGGIAKIDQEQQLMKEFEEHESKEEIEIKELNETIDVLKETSETHAFELHEINCTIEELDEEVHNVEKDIGIIAIDKKTEDRLEILLEDPENSMERLEERISAAKEKMKNLKLQWDEAKQPVQAELAIAEQKYNEKDKKIISEIRRTREIHESLIEDLKTKLQLQTKLAEDLRKLDSNISRSGYTTRILDIIDNIKKQNIDIENVLRDTRKLQKEINTITGQLDRQFTATDDLIFKSAKHDDYSKRAYKLLATLHADCTELVSLVEETGSVIREVREIEDQIDVERDKNVAENLKKITADLEAIQSSTQ